MLTVTFLGTAGSLPTPERNPSAIMINREGELILLDCGEGTQRQMMRARTGMMRLNYIFITHLHADHILGIPGLIETMAFQGREQPLVIAGPVHTIELVEKLSSICFLARDFDVRAMDLEPGEVITAAVSAPNFEVEEYLTLATRNGKIKRMALNELAAVRPSGIIAIGLEEGDELGWARLTHGNNEIILVTELGQALRELEKENDWCH